MATLPTFNKIVMVIEENHGYSEIIGSASAPYINTLVPSAALFTNSHGGPAVLHPSFPNYMQLFSGSPQGLTDDTCPPPGQPFAAANLGSAVIAAGKKFAGYAEDSPTTRTSCTNTTTAKTYAGRHVPWVWFSNVPANSCLDFNTAWPTTAAGFAALPDVSIVTPNLAHDMHSYGTETAVQEITNGDSWLKANISGYLAWAKANNSLLILQWDEDQGTTADTIPTMFLGANVNPGSYAEDITHYNVLRTICELAGATPMAGAATVATITDVWQAGGSGGSVPGTPTGLAVTGVTATSVSLAWTAPTQGPVTGYDVYANGAKVQSPTATSTTVAGLAADTAYSFTVDAFNGNGTGNQTPAVQATTSSTGGPVAPVVQVTQGSATGTSLTLKFTSPVQYYHGVVIALAGYSTGSVSAITLGGVGGTFTKVASSGGINAEIWACLNINTAAQLSTTIVITTTTAGIAAYAYEIESPQQAAGQYNGVYGLQNVTLDETAGKTATGTAWSSGATAATAPGPEFVVGIGAVQAAGTVTGPASGWNNQAAITGVAGAATFGAVSGYQVQAAGSTAAYTYAGTSGTSGTWGGVAATFLLMPQGEVGWSGYIWQPEQAPPGGYTGVTATFTVPALATPAPPAGTGAFSVWVGLGDATPQAGVYCFWDTTKTGNCRTFLWSFYDPGSETWDPTAYPAAAGDSLTVSITSDATYFYLAMANHTQGWSYTQQKSIQVVSLESASGMIMPKNTCEIIVEDEGGTGGTLPNYGTITFTSITVTPAPLGAPVPWAFATQDITQLPGPYSGGSFTMHWESLT